MSTTTAGKVTDVNELKAIAKKIRISILHKLTRSGSGHTGGSLSAVDIAVAVYFSKMNFRADEPTWKERDRFILSKGHAAPLLYAIMAEAGSFPKETIDTLRKVESPLQGHPCCKVLPGVEVSTGSLGQEPRGTAGAVARAGHRRRGSGRAQYLPQEPDECDLRDGRRCGGH